MKQSWIKRLLPLFILGLLLGGCSRESVQPPEEELHGEAPEVNLEEETPVEESPEAMEGTLAPALELKNQKGETVALGEKSEKPRVLTFWVQWNGDALNQLQVLENVYALLKDQVDFYGVHASAFDLLSQEEMAELLEEIGCTFEILNDEASEAQQAYYVGNFPTTFLIDSEGKVTATFTSLLQEDQLLEELEILLEDSNPQGR